VLTILGGNPVYAAAEFKNLSPAPLPVSPEWSPVAAYGGYGAPLMRKALQARVAKAPSRSLHVFGGCACAF